MDTYLRELVAMPTTSSDQDANNLALDYLQTFFDDRGLHCMRYSFNGYSALVATTKKSHKAPKVMLAAHLDVVPGPAKLFTLREDDQNFYGRGVFDMKFAIAAYMATIDMLGSNVADYDVGIMITTEEEIGGLNGTRQLINMGYKPDVCILPDGAKDWQIETFAKGFTYWRIDVAGTSAHGSTPWEGDSATFRLIDLLHELKADFASQTLNTKTLNIGMINGGTAKNQIPAHAYATLDIRYMTNEEYDKIRATIERLCKKHTATFIEEDLGGHPCVNELSHPLVQPFAESIHKITGVDASGIVSYGASDARFFAGINVPCIITRPTGGGQHADSEWIDKEDCRQYSEIILDYLEKIART